MVYLMSSKTNPSDPSLIEWNWQLVKISSNQALAQNVHPFASKGECECGIHRIMLTDYTTPVIEITEKQENISTDKILKLIADRKKS